MLNNSIIEHTVVYTVYMKNTFFFQCFLTPYTVCGSQLQVHWFALKMEIFKNGSQICSFITAAHCSFYQTLLKQEEIV